MQFSNQMCISGPVKIAHGCSIHSQKPVCVTSLGVVTSITQVQPV